MYNAEKYAGRPYVYGESDCYTVVRDWFNNETNLRLDEYPRPTDWFQTNYDTWFQDGFAKEGFRVIDIPFNRLEPGDFLFFAITTQHINHCAVYVGADNILHHLFNRFSAVEPLSRLMRNSCMAITRHPKLVLPTVELEKKDLRDVDPRQLSRKHVHIPGSRKSGVPSLTEGS